jgi:anthranilate/para-aminobenzoate synthase component II
MEVPRFLASTEGDQVLVTAEQHRLEPAVLFEMLGGTTLRFYNINNPKEENMYLAPVPDTPATRTVVTELAATEAQARMSGLIADFEGVCLHLQEVSERQFTALVEHAEQRLHGYTYDI